MLIEYKKEYRTDQIGLKMAIPKELLAKLPQVDEVPAGINFTNISYAAFIYAKVTQNFSVVTVCVCIFWQKDIGTKAARKMLMKLITA